MNFKPVEIQIAIPRTTNAGAAQNEIISKQALDQMRLAQETKQQTERDRKRLTAKHPYKGNRVDRSL